MWLGKLSDYPFYSLSRSQHSRVGGRVGGLELTRKKIIQMGFSSHLYTRRKRPYRDRLQNYGRQGALRFFVKRTDVTDMGYIIRSYGSKARKILTRSNPIFPAARYTISEPLSEPKRSYVELMIPHHFNTHHENRETDNWEF